MTRRTEQQRYLRRLYAGLAVVIVCTAWAIVCMARGEWAQAATLLLVGDRIDHGAAVWPKPAPRPDASNTRTGMSHGGSPTC